MSRHDAYATPIILDLPPMRRCTVCGEALWASNKTGSHYRCERRWRQQHPLMDCDLCGVEIERRGLAAHQQQCGKLHTRIDNA